MSTGTHLAKLCEGSEGSATQVVRWGALAFSSLLAATSGTEAADKAAGYSASARSAVAAALEEGGVRHLFASEAGVAAQQRRKVREEVQECLGLLSGTKPA